MEERGRNLAKKARREREAAEKKADEGRRTRQPAPGARRRMTVRASTQPPPNA